MGKILKKMFDALSAILMGRDKVNNSLATFLNRGNNGILILSILFFIPFLIVSIFLYKQASNWLWSLVPFLFYCGIILFFVLKLGMEKRLNLEKSNHKSEFTGFHLDLNDLVFRKLFAYLMKYEFIDEELTSYDEFFNVMTLDFGRHDDVIHFKMNLAELKYLLEKIKKLKKGLTLTSFEKSNKIYNKGKLVTQKSMTSAYSDSIPDKEFRDHLDNFFKFLTDI